MAGESEALLTKPAPVPCIVYISKEMVGRDARDQVELVKLDDRIGSHAPGGINFIIGHQDGWGHLNSMNLPHEIQTQM
jgi:hypothetical protein